MRARFWIEIESLGRCISVTESNHDHVFVEDRVLLGSCILNVWRRSRLTGLVLMTQVIVTFHVVMF